MLNKKISDFIDKYKLLDKQERYLVALSGGADSVALLLVLKQLGYNIEAVHCNFHLRGDESDRDENFCKELCRKCNVEFHLVHFDTETYAKLHKESIEMAARELRYGYFERLRHDIGAAGICVAHHRDDSVETILINLIRGTGLHGLTGISPRNGYILRPMLCVCHDEIINFLASLNQDYVVDSTNLMDNFVRNKIRLNILPLMKEINPAVNENIFKTSLRLREAEKIIKTSININDIDTEKSHSIEINYVKTQPSPEYFLYYLLSRYGFSPAQIEQISDNLDTQSGKIWKSSTHQLIFDRNRLIIEKTKDDGYKPMRIPETGIYVCASDKKLRVMIKAIDENFIISKNKKCVCLDADKVVFPLTLRTVTVGDKFVPLGMRGTKLVSDFLTDCKKTLFEKRRQLVVTSAGGDIIWVVGERPDNRFRITDTTTKAIILSIEDIPQHV